MKYTIYKMQFRTGVHFGQGRLDNGGIECYADTIFSAICIEALKIGGKEYLEKVVDTFKTQKALLSDAFPYSNNTYYLPKPFMKIEKSDTDSDKNDKKQFKKMNYIPLEQMQEYINGSIDARKVNESIKEVYTEELRTRVSVNDTDQAPYNLQVNRFTDNNGLYIILGYDSDEIKDMLENILVALSYTGIGGKISTGLGKFELINKKVPTILEDMLTQDADTYMTLSISLPKDEELDDIVENGMYTVIKRSGFVNSSTYADNFTRKKDIYMMKSGSCFAKKYNGDIYDVSTGGNHAVYRYGKPIMIGVK